MFNSNAVFPNNARNMEVLLEAFFNVQHNEHMKAWRWHLFTKNSNMNAVDAALAKAAADLRSARV